MSIESFRKVLMLGTHENGRVFVRVEWNGTRLSVSGVVGPKANGDCRGSAGQCIDSLRDEIAFDPQWSRETANELVELWDRWHLNDMRAGSPAQEAHLRGGNYITGERPMFAVDRFDWTKEELRRAGLNPDPNHNDYRYGSAWLSEDVPDDVLERFKAFPESSVACPWGNL